MIFHSIDFLLFLPVAFAMYWLLPKRLQNPWLLISSYFFYGYVHPWFLYLIFISTFVDYHCALGMRGSERKRKLLLWVSLCANLGMLGVFKYFNFFIENVQHLLTSIGMDGFQWNLHIVLPVGISFYTFQTLSYTIDVYRGRMEARKNWIDVAVYVAFFPQLVAGPIERAPHFLPQVETPRRFNPHMLRSGLHLLIWGFFKKLVIADNVAVVANKIFLLPDPDFFLLWSGVLAFCVQIFADFSAYTDIARGCARLLGFELLENFNHPYISQNPAEFWRRWHMSLSSWIRDYIYIPLGGSRCSKLRESFNLFLTFFLCGLWHGAAWNFVLWGLFHACLIFAYRLGAKGLPWAFESKLLTIPRIIVFFALTNVGWLIFREGDIQQLFLNLYRLPGGENHAQIAAAALFATRVLLYSSPLLLQTAADLLARRFGWYGTRAFELGRDLASAGCLIGIVSLHSTIRVDFIYFQF